MSEEKLKKMEAELRNELSEEKLKYIDKYFLKLNPRRKWVTNKNNISERIYFSHNFILKNNILEIVFRKYHLCFAKIKYFRKNLDKYLFYKYDTKKGFIQTELWDTEFFLHKKSKKFIDLRYLQQITKVEIFKELVEWLENVESSGDS